MRQRGIGDLGRRWTCGDLDFNTSLFGRSPAIAGRNWVLGEEDVSSLSPV